MSHDQMESWVGKIADVTLGTARDFPVGFDKCENFFGEFVFLHFFLGT